MLFRSAAAVHAPAEASWLQEPVQGRVPGHQHRSSRGALPRGRRAKVVEGSRERIQIFEGVVIARKGAGISETYTVRKISNGIGVERTFPIHTPRVDKIEVVRYGKVRRAKLYYLRALQGKAARIKEIRR